MSGKTKKAEVMPAQAQAQPDALAVYEERPVSVLLEMAIDRGVPVEALEKLVALHERVSDRHAAEEFNAAMAAFQAACPPIPKDAAADFVTKGGQRVRYQFAPLPTIANTVRPHLHALGLSYSWDSVMEDNLVRCTCTLRHVNGHAETASFSAPIEGTQMMSGPQRAKAALTFAQRVSLIQVLGLTDCDPDTDANPAAKISEEQIAMLQTLITETGSDEKRFLSYLGVKSLEDVPAGQYQSAVSALEVKRGKPK